MNRRIALFLATVVAVSPLVAAPSAPAATNALTVSPGQSIQAAIDKATPGSEITINAGTYTEQLLVTTSGLRISGKGAKLVAPKTLKRNICTDVTRIGTPDKATATDAGLCIAGAVKFGDFDPVLFHRPATLTGKAITGVSIVGLTVSGFGTGIIVAGADNTTIDGVSVLKAQSYGVLAATSPRTTYKNNVIRNDPGTIAPIGLCVEASPNSTLRLNEVSGYVNGLCLSSSHVKAETNNLHDNHYGIYVDPGMTDVTIRDNKIMNNTRDDGAPIPSGIGIFVEGASDVRITSNTISGNSGDNAQFGDMGSGGVVIVDHADPAPATMSSKVVVTNNRFTGNGNGKGKPAADVWLASAGTGMSFKANGASCVSNTAGRIGTC